jgi:transcriptional regulator of arginine metabolism
MQVRTRTYSKPDRQRLIGSLVARKRIGTQFELKAALESVGCAVTQATISRDIRELGLEKTHDPVGRPRYMLPQGGPKVNPRDALDTILRQFGRQATAAQNIVVIHSELGSAPAIARALDRLEHPRVIGTLAGDDTCLVVARDARDAAALAGDLGSVLS